MLCKDNLVLVENAIFILLVQIDHQNLSWKIIHIVQPFTGTIDVNVCKSKSHCHKYINKETASKKWSKRFYAVCLFTSNFAGCFLLDSSDRPKRHFAETTETETLTKNLPKQPNRNGRNSYKGNYAKCL